MSVSVRIPGVLRPLTAGAPKVTVTSGDTLAAVLAELGRAYPELQDRLLDGSGNLSSFVNIFVNGEDARFLGGSATKVQAGDEVSIVPAVAGG